MAKKKTGSSLIAGASLASQMLSRRQADPPVAYNFMVSFAPDGISISSSSMLALSSLAFDASFTQISGLKTELEYDTVKSGGFNNQVYHLPKGVKRSSMTLKRGLASIASPLLQWCLKTMEEPKFLTPRTMIVTLLDKNPIMPPIMMWSLYNVIPVRWEINEFDATKSEIVIESIDVVFTKMEVWGR
jgi:phage tail-like protein